MNSRIRLMLVVIMVMLGTIILILAGRPKPTLITAVAPLETPLPLRAQTLPPVVALPLEPLLAPSEQTLPSRPTVATPSESTIAPTAVTQTDANKTIDSSEKEHGSYTSVEGDTLSNVVFGLLGSDTEKNRATVIAANPSLQTNPDRVLAGKVYHLTAPDAASILSSPEPPSASIPAHEFETPIAALPYADRLLKYTARPGDSVSILAAVLLGDNSKTNRDAIISYNQSLHADPDRVVAGKTYTIPTSNGLSAAPESAVANLNSPAIQPDADQVVQNGTGRDLRYVALAGDTVSKLAKILLGSDTPANREAIISNNASLKSDPDHVVAGQMYWIAAPAAAIR